MNPFRETVVASPWDLARVDVTEIHQKVFEECVRGVEHVREGGHSASLLIHGEAGSGKTHLLRRLRAYLAPTAPSSTYRKECLYVWVRLQTSPRMIWRTVRRTLVDDWFRPVAGHRSQFERILFHRLSEIRPAEGDLERWYEYMLEKQPAGLQQLIQQIATELDLDRNTSIAFEHIAFGRHLRDLRAWLAGVSLPEAALERMDLAQDEGNDDEREDQSKQVVLMLCRLAGNGLPIVVCFDQVEALQDKTGETEGLFAFGKLTSILHDGTSNVLTISCMQSSFFNDLKAHIRGADQARMTSLGALSLHPLDRSQARRLIQERLAALPETVQAGATPDEFWPLSKNDFESLFSAGSVSPRRLLTTCAERLETRNGGRKTSDEFLKESWESLLETKISSNSPEQTEEILEHGLPALVSLLIPETQRVRDEMLADVSLVFRRGEVQTGVSVCSQANMTSLAARLRRLKEQFDSPRLQRLVLIRDQRVPLSSGARRARTYLDELEQQGAVIVHPSKDVLAALDTLRALLSDAKSGNLTCQDEAISPQTVERWLLSNLSAGVRDFVDEVLDSRSATSETVPEARDFEQLATLLDSNPVVSLEQAAQSLGKSPGEVASLIRRNPDHFALIGEPPEILFRVVSAGEPAE